MAAKIIKSNDVGFFEPVTQDPIYNWIWADVNKNENEEEDDFDNYDNYNQDDLRDPDMTTIGTGGIASAAILQPEDNKNFPFPTLEPGFDLLSDDWFQVNHTETGSFYIHNIKYRVILKNGTFTSVLLRKH